MLTLRDERLCSQQPGRKRSHFFKSFFFTKLFENGTYNFESVRRWSLRHIPGEDIFSLDKVFIPCNVTQEHWTCLVAHMGERRIESYDSMGGCGGDFTFPFLRYLEDEWEMSDRVGEFQSSDWVVTNVNEDAPSQMNGFDCGVFTIMFANYISINRQLQFNQSDVNTIRNLLILTILGQWAIDDDGNFKRGSGD